MKHQEFMRELCGILNRFSNNEIGEEIPCFCMENPLAKAMVKDGTWRAPAGFLVELAERLGVNKGG